MRSNMKKVLAGLSSACILAAAAPVCASAADASLSTVIGDADLSGEVDINDVVSVLIHTANPNQSKLSEQGRLNADVYQRGDGLNALDATSIQKYLASLIETLPESYMDGYTDPVSNTGKIHLMGDSVSVEGDTLKVDGLKAIVTASGVYEVDGSVTGGQIVIDTPADDIGEVELILTDVSMTGTDAPCIYSTAENGAAKTKITVIGDNTLTDISASAYTESGVIYTNNKLTITKNSTGTLNINSSMNTAINSEKKLNLNGGTIVINTDDPTVESVTACSAAGIKCDKNIEIEGASVSIKASLDGINGNSGFYLIDGDVSIKAGNDAVQASTEIAVSGGDLIASGDRGLRLDANGLLNITGGTVFATATDYQVTGNEVIDMSGSTQTIMLFDMTDEWKKDNAVTVGDLTFNSRKKYDYVLVSDPSLRADGNYSVTIGGQTAVHSESKDYNFTNSGAATQYTMVTTIDSQVVPGIPTEDNLVTAVSFSDTAITLKNAAGNAVDAKSAENLSVNGTTVTVTKAGDYEFSGSCNNGQVVVSTDNTAEPAAVVTISLSGLTLSNSSAAPIYVENVGDECVISAKNGTENVISDGTSHTDTYVNSDGETIAVNAAIFARDDLKIKGKGTLTVNGNTEDGIVSKNDLKIQNGTINVTAVDDGIRGNDSVRIGDPDATDFSTLNVTVKTTASGDGIKATNTEAGKGIVTVNGGTVNINAYADGIQAEQDVVINGGDITIYTYQGSGYTGSGTTTTTQPGGRPGMGGWGGMGTDGNPNKVENSAKGIKATGIYDAAGTTWQSGGNIAINGGNITVDSSDDAVHCGGNLDIKGGQLKLATADDALHADHDLTLGTNGGSYGDFAVYAAKCYEGVEAQNIYQYSGTVVVKADDDGYNAAGGADGSGNTNPGGFFPGQMGGGNYSLNISGGIAIVQSASGDHDAFDSNGSLTVSGGIVIANGQEPLDSDGTNTVSGGTVLAVSSQSTGTVAANTQFTVADSSGKVIVSFKTMQGMGAITQKHTDTTISMYTGGTISGGTDLISIDDSQPVYANGTISGGTAVSSSSSGGNTRPWG